MLRLNRTDEIDVMRSMHYMIDAGMSMHDIISELTESIKDKNTIAKLEAVNDLMTNSGFKFADALESAGLFEQYIPVIRTGQETGSLPRVLEEIIATHDTIHRLRKKVKTMVLYPIILMFVSVLLGYGLSFLLEKILISLPEKDINGTLQYTLAKFIVSYREIIFLTYGGLLALGIWFISMNASNIPYIRNIFNTITVGQTFKMISLCIKNGLSLRETFELTSNIVKEKKWKQVMEVIAEESQERNFYELIDELSDFLPLPDMLIIRSNVKGGSMSKGFDYIGSKKLENSYSLIERTSPMLQIGAYMMVGVQLATTMFPIYALLINFAGRT